VGQDPSAIRQDIEQTRAEMGDTVEAIGYKTDVKSRAKESVQNKIGGVRERITGAKDTVGDKTPSTGDVKEGAQRATGVAQSNPIGLGVAAIAGGFLLGMVIPSTNVENEKLGPKADELKHQAKETASEAVDRGKQVAQEAASAAADTAKEQGQQQAEELKSSAQQS
jgi:hypothetical protein